MLTSHRPDNATQDSALHSAVMGLVAAALLLVGVGLGWLFNSYYTSRQDQQGADPCLRQSGYTFISPLLLCDTDAGVTSSSLKALEQKLQAVIEKHRAAGDIDIASVFFRDPRTGTQVNINADEKYFPASLKKVPVMMAYYKKAETNPALLTTRGLLQGQQDFNAGVEIPPALAAQYGKEYSVDELINLMIRYSDNNGFMMLSGNLGETDSKSLYDQLQIQYPDDELSISDFITAHQFSFFLRTLYNATYLNREYSEKALRLLSQTEFKEGLVAGVPEGMPVAHKFGVLTTTGADGKLLRELHDCGIVYNGERPYLLCVMTKSSADIARAQETIKELSAATYGEVR